MGTAFSMVNGRPGALTGSFIASMRQMLTGRGPSAGRGAF